MVNIQVNKYITAIIMFYFIYLNIYKGLKLMRIVTYKLELINIQFKCSKIFALC